MDYKFLLVFCLYFIFFLSLLLYLVFMISKILKNHYCLIYFIVILCFISLSYSHIITNKRYNAANRFFKDINQHNLSFKEQIDMSSFIEKEIQFYKSKLLLNESEICPYHPFPREINEPYPSILIDMFNAIESILKNVTNHQKSPPPGLMCSIIYGNEIIHQFGQGSKNLSEPENPPDLNTVFGIGSITKLFPSIMTMQLEESGIIRSLDDPLQSLAPDFEIRNPYSDTDKVTFRSVLSQLSGLPRQTPCESCFDCDNVVNCNVTSEWIFNRSKYESLILPSYTRPSYSNFGFSLLGRIPEPIIEKSFEEYVEDNIILPLDMNRSGFYLTDDIKNNMAQGYSFDLSPVEFTSYGWENPSGGAFSSVNDLSKLIIQFIEAHNMKDSKILTATSMKRMMQAAFLDYDGQTLISYPWESFFIDSYFVRCKAGNTVGYSGVSCVIPEMSVGFVILVNADVDTFSYAIPTMEIIIPTFYKILNEITITAPLPPNPNDYEGEFSPYPEGNGIIKISNDNNERMIMYLKELPIFNSTMVYLEENLFQIIAPNSSPSRFMGSCQNIELGAFQYESIYYSPDKQFIHFGNGGVYQRN